MTPTATETRSPLLTDPQIFTGSSGTRSTKAIRFIPVSYASLPRHCIRNSVRPNKDCPILCKPNTKESPHSLITNVKTYRLV